MPDYSRSRIYKLWALDTPRVYIDATTQDLAHRLSDHRRLYKSYIEGETSYNPSYEILKYPGVRIELIKYYPCENRRQLEDEKYRIIRASDCINAAFSLGCRRQRPPLKTAFDRGQQLNNKCPRCWSYRRTEDFLNSSGKRLKICLKCREKQAYYRRRKPRTDLKKHLESEFYDYMDWGNYRKVWKIETIKPIDEPNITLKEVIKRLHFTNLKPVLI